MPHLAAVVESFKFAWQIDVIEYPQDQEEAEEEEAGDYDYYYTAASAEYGSFLNMALANPNSSDAGACIKNADDFSGCITEIVSQLTSLQSFGWICRVVPMPAGVFEALRKLSSLRELDTNLWFPGNYQHLPLWELASDLKRLWIWRLARDSVHDETYSPGGRIKSVTEEELIAFAVPAEPCLGYHEVILASAWRILATAAKGMHLRDLYLQDSSMFHTMWKPFSVRSLLPGWIGINDWGIRNVFVTYHWDAELRWHSYRPVHWTITAVMLRHALYHMSLLPMTQRGARLDAADSRLLTQGDVQAMREEFKGNKLPLLTNPAEILAMTGGQMPPARALVEDSTIDRYFYWLQDAELAQQVADAWNAVVQRGDADLCKCYCPKCSASSQPA